MTYNHAEGAMGVYGEVMTIEITKWDNVSHASSFLDRGIKLFADSENTTSLSRGEEHWFSHTGSEESVFAWRRGVWVFDVRAPDEVLRDQAVVELTLGKDFRGSMAPTSRHPGEWATRSPASGQRTAHDNEVGG